MLAGLLKAKARKDAQAAVCPGAEGIAVAVVRREEGLAPALECCAYAGLDGDAGDVIASLARQHRLDAMPCTSVVELEAYSLLLVEAPDVPPAELRAAMRWRVKDLIDFHVDDAVIDVFEVPGQRAAGGRMMYAVVARSAMVKRLVDQLLDGGLRLAAVDIPEFAVRNIAALIPEDVGGVAFVFLDREQGLIALTRQETLYMSRRLELGRGMLLAPGGERLAPEAEGRLDAVVIEIQRSLDYYESHFSQPPVAGVVLSPLGGGGRAITDYLQSQLGLGVRELDLNEVIDADEPIAPALQVQCFTAIGAALRQEERAL